MTEIIVPMCYEGESQVRLLFGFFALLQVFQACSIPCKIVSMRRALEEALLNRSSKQAAWLEGKRLRHESQAQLSAYLPQARMRSALLTGAKNTFSNSAVLLEVKQVWFDFGVLSRRYYAARQQEFAAQWLEKAEADFIRRDIERDALKLWEFGRKKYQVMAESDAAHSRMSRSYDVHGVGLFDDVKIVDEKAHFTTTMAQVLSYQDDLFNASSAFHRSIQSPELIELDIFSAEQFVDEMIASASEWSLKELCILARNNRKDVRVKEEEIKEQEYLEQLYARAYLPKSGFFFRLDRGGIVGTSLTDTSQANDECGLKVFWQLGMEFEWEFDGLASLHHSAAAEAGIAKALAQKYDLLNTINHEVESEYACLQKKMKDLVAHEKEAYAAAYEYERKLAQRKVGLLTNTELDAARDEKEKAEFALVQARGAVANSSSELLFRCGYPDDELRIRRNNVA